MYMMLFTSIDNDLQFPLKDVWSKAGVTILYTPRPFLHVYHACGPCRLDHFSLIFVIAFRAMAMSAVHLLSCQSNGAVQRPNKVVFLVLQALSRF